MKIDLLEQLFRNIPVELKQNLSGRDFKTCWYPSSSIDKRPIVRTDYSNPEIDFKDKIEVFFYNDLDFFSLRDGLYSQYHNGKIIFGYPPGLGFNSDPDFNPVVKSFDFEFIEIPDKYALTGNYISGDIVLNNGDIFPRDLNENGFNSMIFHSKMRFRAFVTERLKILSDFFPDAFELYNDNLVERFCASNDSSVRALFCQIPNEKIKIVDDFLNMKLEKQFHTSFESFDFSTYQFQASLVKHLRLNGDPVFTFYIDCDDFTFEQVLLNLDIKIDYVAKGNGWCGPCETPLYQDHLGWQYLPPL